MAGASIPLTPIVHQMISVGPIPLFADTVGEIVYPIIRDMDTNMYERQHGGDMEVGSYAHRPIIVRPDEIPSIEESVLSPTEMPFTQEDFDPQIRRGARIDALALRRREGRRTLRHQRPHLHDPRRPPGARRDARGEGPVVGRASWIKEGPGIARAVAQWMNGDVPDIDLHEADIARFYSHQRTRRTSPPGRARALTRCTASCTRASNGSRSDRPVAARCSSRSWELGAVFFETVGWERPYWYDGNDQLLAKYSDQVVCAQRRMGVTVVVTDH